MPASSTSPIGDELEALRVEFVGEGLALGDRCAHGLCPFFELPADAASLDRCLVAVPGEAFNADGRDVAAEAAESLDERDFNPGPRCSEGCRQSAGAGADDQDVGSVHDVNLTGWLGDGSVGRWHGSVVARLGSGGRDQEAVDANAPQRLLAATVTRCTSRRAG